jgi:hypothetical protein
VVAPEPELATESAPAADSLPIALEPEAKAKTSLEQAQVAEPEQPQPQPEPEPEPVSAARVPSLCTRGTGGTRGTDPAPRIW